MDQICPRCGCRSFHYNRSRMRVECDACGHALTDPQELQLQRQDDRNFQQACEHLRAGNWQQAAGLLLPLMERRPVDRRLYLAAFRAATKDYQDLEAPAPLRMMAIDAWDKLVRLGGLSGEMVRYGMRRREKYREKYRAQRQAFLLLAAVAAGMFFGCIFAVADDSPLGALVFLAMGIYAAYKAGRIRPSPRAARLRGRARAATGKIRLPGRETDECVIPRADGARDRRAACARGGDVSGRGAVRRARGAGLLRARPTGSPARASVWRARRRRSR